MTNLTLRLAVALVTGVLLVTVLTGDPPGALRAQQRRPPNAGDVRILPVRDNVYMLAGAGNNITVQTGDDGVLLVDTGRESMSDQALAAIRTLSQAPIRQIILTNHHPDAAGGMAKLRQAGNAVLGGNFAGRAGAAILAYESAFMRLSEKAASEEEFPTDSFYVARHDFAFNGEAVEILHQPRAVTDGDTLIHLRRSDVLATGDMFDMTSYPMIDEAAGGSINGVIAGLNHILEITVPAALQEGGTLVIPSKGRLCDEGDVNWYRYMITVIRDRVQDMVKKGMTLAQVKAARPTLEYDARFGSTTGPWTTDMFVEAVYRGLSAAKLQTEAKPQTNAR